ncbi:MAG: universal stress protein [Proteobacteria bacterium]|nr:universal stress protein [Pseudomonadota bacterium]
MSESKPILTSIDLTDYSKESLLYSSQLARDMKRDLIILHVIHDPEDSPGFYTSQDDKGSVKPMEITAKGMMDNYLNRISQESEDADILTAKRVMVTGLPFDQIIIAIEKYQPEMLVVGSHGRRSLSKLLMGSVVDRLVKESAVPILVVKTDAYLELIKNR